MRCAACGTEHHDSARFCGACGAPLARRCPTCGADAAPGVRYCTSCGSAQDGNPDRPGTPAEPVAERRRVSVVFVDLEGFTSLAELLDPEEVRAVQSRYFEAARSVIARYGGTVEKFIGDAVVAIWGAPVAHEDDADRAVQAAFALLKAIRLLGGTAARHQLSGRASVATGEVAVNIGAIGQGIVAGDLLNVASRLQGQAPSGRVLVDDATRLLAHAVATFEPVGELELKGRSAPVLAHVASQVAAPPSPVLRGSHGGPFVGRDAELRELLDLQEGVVRDGRSRLVSITGIAGIGKSRLAWELGGALDRRSELVAWHAGRAPAYGEGITFSAVADMVRHRIRAPAGSAPEIVRRQLSDTLRELVRDDSERSWLEPRLMALLGDERLDAFERDDLFAAWRRFFERVSEISPAVLVFEDLQWADPALLDFVEHLATWMRRHPTLVVTVARPELLDQRPSWGAGVGRFTTMQLDRLPDAAMRRLLAQRAPELGGDVLDHIVRHAGGVPLYAVEVARSLADTAGTPRERRSIRRIAEAQPDALAVPDSLHGLIAARIDALPAAERRLLLSAAVLGRRFPVEGLVAIGAVSSTARDGISALVRREFLASEDGGDPASGELGFVQEVVREAAYRTVSRQTRRTLHLAAARWLEGKADEDAAEALANHLSVAHDLAPDHPDAGRIARRAVSALRRAAGTAIARRVPRQALGHIERALRLTDSTEQRAVVLDEAATVASAAGHLDLAERHLRELAEIQAAADHRRSAARTRARLASVLLTAQRNEPAVHELETAMRAIRSIGRDAAGVELAAQLARARMLIGDDAGGLRWAKRGLTAAADLALDGIAADLRVTRGTARVRLGDRGGLDDLQGAIEEAQRLGAIGTELRARNNLAWLTMTDDPRATIDLARQAVALASERGVGDMAAQLAEVACAAAMDTGDWSWAIDTIEELDHPGTPIANRINLAATGAILHALRGSPDAGTVLGALEPLPGDLDGQIMAGIQLATAWIAFLSGDLAAAGREADAAGAGLLGMEQVQALILAARSRLWAADPAGAEKSLAQLTTPGVSGRVADAHVATIRAGITALGDRASGSDAYRDAAGAWAELGLDGDLAICLTDEARILGERPTAEALTLYERLGADGLRRLLEGTTTARR